MRCRCLPRLNVLKFYVVIFLGGRSRPISHRALVTKQVTVCSLSPSNKNNRPRLHSRYSDSLGLDGPGVEFRRGWYFPHPSRPALGPTQPPVSFPDVKRPKRGADSTPPSRGYMSLTALSLHGELTRTQKLLPPTVCTTADPFSLSRYGMLCSLLLSVRALCYQPSYHNCFAIVRRWPPTCRFIALNRWQSLGYQSTWYRPNHKVGSLVTKLYAM